MLMDNDEVSDVVGTTCFNELTHYIVSSVQSLGIGEYQPQLLYEQDAQTKPLITQYYYIKHAHEAGKTGWTRD